eukprot:CAMPEP_0174343228 /NCGR_PEP_ID=MMETSP0810-20121108/26783_1 /TAXON_ID=73025 ORGANISM="Eutreptiella gymnastica-like, Strain CCMP1594" /NCGR_SAMPLE_ID=MMETSP0810 /ASSEMBLY_ACC=CAM_ASM_000659 /LENGTH=52 /DNA_ID=CAMNT_0015465817 /DNA_START=450 /DNA_END=608 /DNA_ORIENTATION=-
MTGQKNAPWEGHVVKEIPWKKEMQPRMGPQDVCKATPVPNLAYLAKDEHASK